jgi:hypothetical protein
MEVLTVIAIFQLIFIGLSWVISKNISGLKVVLIAPSTKGIYGNIVPIILKTVFSQIKLGNI